MSKKLKYGSFAAGLTVAVLALVIVVNAVFTAFVQGKSLYLDMTKEQIYSISDAADDIYSRLSDREIEIIFFTEPDVMMNYEYQKMIYEYALKLEDRYDNITVKYIDSIENPDAIAKYTTTSIPQVYTTDVVITNGDAFRVMSMERFYVFNDAESTEPWAFYGEYRFATALMQLCYDEMLACFTVGHDEDTSSAYLATLLEEAGFEVREIDLAKEDIPEEARVLIINDPAYDFTGAYDEVNEIDKLDKFLDRYGNLMVFSDPDTAASLPNLSEFLEEWGISFVPAHIEDKENCVDTAGQSVIAEYTAEGVGADLNEKLRTAENPPKTIVSNAMPIEILWEQHNSVNVSSILNSYDSAKAYSLEDASVVSEGKLNLMTLSVRSHTADNDEKYQNYVLCAGTSSFADEKYINNNAYGNRDIIYSLMLAFGKEAVPVDLGLKVFDDMSLDITLTEANAWTVIFTAVAPTVILVCGAVVLIRRRYL